MWHVSILNLHLHYLVMFWFVSVSRSCLYRWIWVAYTLYDWPRFGCQWYDWSNSFEHNEQIAYSRVFACAVKIMSVAFITNVNWFIKLSRCIKASLCISEERLNFLHSGLLKWKFDWQSFKNNSIFLSFVTHIKSSSSTASRDCVDEDDNGNSGLKTTTIY